MTEDAALLEHLQEDALIDRKPIMIVEPRVDIAHLREDLHQLRLSRLDDLPCGIVARELQREGEAGVARREAQDAIVEEAAEAVGHGDEISGD